MKQGDEVWIRGYYEQDEGGKPWIRVVCMYGLRINHAGVCSVKVAKQDVRTEPTKQARKGNA